MVKESTSGKKLIVNSVIYSCSGLLLRCFNFFLLPLYTNYLTTKDYGVTSIATSFISTMNFIACYSLFSAVKRFYVDFKDDTETLKRFYGTICSFSFLSGLFWLVLLTIFRDILSARVFSGIDYFPIIFLSLVSIVFNSQQIIYDNILRSQQRALKSSIVTIAFFFLMLFLNILMIVVLHLGAVGSLIAIAAGYVFYTLFAWIDMLSSGQITICIDRTLLKSALKYSIPIMPHNLSTNIALLFSKIFIGGAKSISDVGVYTIAAQFGDMSDTVQGYVSNAYGPWLYEKLHAKDPGYKNTIRSLVKLLIFTIGFALLGIALFSQDLIILFLSKDYANAWKYVPMIVLVYTIKMAYYFYVEVLFYHKSASKYLCTATLTSSFLNILLSYYLIPLFGVYGSILADAISMFIRVVIIVFISLQFENVGLRIQDFVLSFFTIILFSAGGLFFSFSKYQTVFNIWNFLFKVVVILIYVAFSAYINRDSLAPIIAKLKTKYAWFNSKEESI